MKAHVLEGKDTQELKWKKEALKLPVLQMASAKGVDASRALTYAALQNQVVSLSHDVSYRDALKIHAIRAGVVNKIKGELVRSVLEEFLLTILRPRSTQKILRL